MATKNKRTRKYLYLLALAVIIIVVVVVLEETNTTHFFHTQKAKSGTIPTLATKSTKATSKNTSSSGTSSTQASDSTKSDTGSQVAASSQDSGQAPTAPFGSFVSNHSPNLSGSPTPSQEQSLCNTTPGATCYITFTQNGVTKKLESQAADSSGIVSWAWDVNQAGFTEGSWQITAVATLNGKTASTTDSKALMVQP